MASPRTGRPSFRGDLREAEDFALKVEYDKRARTFVDPRTGQALFRAEAATCVEVADNLPGAVAVRDSKNPGSDLVLGLEQWAAFIAAVRTGELDG